MKLVLDISCVAYASCVAGEAINNRLPSSYFSILNIFTCLGFDFSPVNCASLLAVRQLSGYERTSRDSCVSYNLD